ncbi:hypothetical protein PR202_ga21181 [Eleusine coracana subsp. coracana]|uniref:FAD-binding PCMH-type domain-containing protein n=1 Tax=Eleusine coracana subsp. coracana TaxID=191504 RepID=A0AAV5D001_ELECO|nr:hypothetical protein PR202_ga21181 [Eleusine coracana subsp. coracana]
MMLAYMDRAAAAAEPEDAGSPSTVAASAAADDEAARDFGGLVSARPAAVVLPASVDDVAAAIRAAALRPNLTVAARGNGHSVSGQAMAEGGLVLDMRALALPRRIHLVRTSQSPNGFAADVPGGALWEEVLHWGVKQHGLAPASWTDYLRLTVGGTLSNGGVSGQSFRYGPQVRWTRVVYASFADYTADAEWLVTRPADAAFDYVEGFAFVNSDDPVNGWPMVPFPGGAGFDPALLPAGAGPVLYCLEVVLYQHNQHQHQPDDDDDEDKVRNRGEKEKMKRKVSAMMAPLKYVRGLEFGVDVGYVEFLSRVNRVEEEARRNGSWAAPHPWLNLFVSARDIVAFDAAVIKGMLADGIDGPMLIYPMLRSKWDPNTSVALPDGEIFYLVALLRFCRDGGAAVEELVSQNRAVLAACRANGYDFKTYFPSYRSEPEWRAHFGATRWKRFVDRKARYDPLAILAPGQKIFPRATTKAGGTVI